MMAVMRSHLTLAYGLLMLMAILAATPASAASSSPAFVPPRATTATSTCPFRSSGNAKSEQIILGVQGAISRIYQLANTCNDAAARSDLNNALLGLSTTVDAYKSQLNVELQEPQIVATPDPSLLENVKVTNDAETAEDVGKFAANLITSGKKCGLFGEAGGQQDLLGVFLAISGLLQNAGVGAEAAGVGVAFGGEFIVSVIENIFDHLPTNPGEMLSKLNAINDDEDFACLFMDAEQLVSRCDVRTLPSDSFPKPSEPASSCVAQFFVGGSGPNSTSIRALTEAVSKIQGAVSTSNVVDQADKYIDPLVQMMDRNLVDPITGTPEKMSDYLAKAQADFANAFADPSLGGQIGKRREYAKIAGQIGSFLGAYQNLKETSAHLSPAEAAESLAALDARSRELALAIRGADPGPSPTASPGNPATPSSQLNISNIVAMHLRLKGGKSKTALDNFEVEEDSYRATLSRYDAEQALLTAQRRAKSSVDDSANHVAVAFGTLVQGLQKRFQDNLYHLSNVFQDNVQNSGHLKSFSSSDERKARFDDSILPLLKRCILTEGLSFFKTPDTPGIDFSHNSIYDPGDGDKPFGLGNGSRTTYEKACGVFNCPKFGYSVFQSPSECKKQPDCVVDKFKNDQCRLMKDYDGIMSRYFNAYVNHGKLCD